MTIFYFDALAGARKTRVLNDEATRRAGLHRKILFAQPSRLLIDKTVADMKARHPKVPITKIYGNDERACSGVIKRLCKHFIDADADGEVVFVTHTALLRAPFLQNANDWTLFIDEVPGVDVFEELRVPETHGLVTNLVEFTLASASYALLEPRAGLSKIAENKSRDEMLAGFQDLASRTGYTSIYDNTDPALVELDDEDALVGSLRSMHRRYYAKKDDNFVFSPAHFVPEIPGVDTGRGLANISHLRGIWLDNDGGDLSHAEFAALFPALRIVVWNTFSSTQAQPRRAFIPTTLAMDIHVHRLIMRQIHNTLNKAG